MDFRMLRRVAVGVAALAVVLVAWFALQVDPLGGQGRLVVVTIAPGESISQVVSDLHAKGVVHSPLALTIDLSLFGTPTVHPGAYEFAQNSSFGRVRAVLGGAPNVPSITVTPGMTVHEVALEVATDEGTGYATAFLTAAQRAAAASPYDPDQSPPSLPGDAAYVSALEGLIGPGTYLITPGETPDQLVAALTAGFDAEASAAGLTPATRVAGLDAYQVVTAASIVEREGYYPSNMPDVARVILNRLARGGGLQMDSTVKYPLGIDAGAVTSAMLATVTPYNTYLHAGLTPTPICTVSPDALHAVLHAPAGPWLYFVVVDKAGHEAFATTYAQQLANEARARRNGAA